MVGVAQYPLHTFGSDGDIAGLSRLEVALPWHEVPLGQLTTDLGVTNDDESNRLPIPALGSEAGIVERRLQLLVGHWFVGEVAAGYRRRDRLAELHASSCASGDLG